MDSPDHLVAAARRAYTRGRLRHALLLGVVPIALLAMVSTMLRPRPEVFAVAVPLAVVCVAGRFVGRGWDRAVGLGVRAGVVPWIAAMASATDRSCMGTGVCPPWCAPLCAGAGLLVGVWLGVILPRRMRPQIVLGTLVIASATAAVGCLPLGYGTFAGAAVGLALGVAPTWALRHARA